jgi:hypothetical protein
MADSYHGPVRLVEDIGMLEHGSTFCHDALCIGRQQPAPNQVLTRSTDPDLSPCKRAP